MSNVYIVDKVKERLQLAAEQSGAMPVEPVEFIVDATGGDGTDEGIDAAGHRRRISPYRASEEHSSANPDRPRTEWRHDGEVCRR